MDEETREKIGAIIKRAESIPEPPEDTPPEQHQAWLIKHLVESSEARPLLHPALVRLLDEAETPEDEWRVIGEWVAMEVLSE